MIITVSEIPEEGLEVDFVRRIDGLDADAHASLSVRRIGPDVIVGGDVDSKVPAVCGRCLGEMVLDVTVHVDVACGSQEHDDEGEVELSMEDMARAMLNEEIDLGQMVEEQVLLNVPMRPLCSESCKGLCPVCGADLNSGTCGCPPQQGDPRMNILGKLLNKGEKE